MKKKLIAIVTSLAMVATMVPATAAAATKAAPQATAVTKSAVTVQTFKTLVGQLPKQEDITKDNADRYYGDWNSAYTILMTLTVDERSEVQAEKATFDAVGSKLAAIYVELTETEIAKVAQAGKVKPNEDFSTIETYVARVGRLMGIQGAAMYDAIPTYYRYDAAKIAKNIANAIDNETDLADPDAIPAALEAAVKAVEADPDFQSANEQTRAMASNYKDYTKAKKKLGDVESGKALLKSYTERMNVQTNVLNGNQTESNVAAAEALQEEMAGNKKLQDALTVVTTGSERSAYNSANTALGNAITAAETAIDEKAAAADFTAKVKALPSEIKLKDMAKVQEVYALREDASAAWTTGPSNPATGWKKHVDPAVKTAADNAITALGAIVTDMNTTVATGTAGGATPEEAAAATKAKNDFTEAALTAFAVPTSITPAEKTFLENAKDVLVETTDGGADPKLVGVSVSTLYNGGATTSIGNTIAAALTTIGTQETRLEEAAAAFVKTIVDLNAVSMTDLAYESKLNKATAEYEALDASYKKGGENYAVNVYELNDVAGTSLDNSVKNAYKVGLTATMNDGSTLTKKSLSTLIKEYKDYAANSAQDAIIRELIAGIDKLPNDATKLTASDQEAVYALRDKREQLNEDNLERFEDQDSGSYNDKLDQAIEAIDKLYVADLIKQISDLTIIKATATPEEIAAAKAANQAARDAYDKLTDTQKEMVSNAATLRAAETAVSNAEVQYAKDQMTAVLDGVDVEKMTVEQAKAILAVKDMIDEMSAVQKGEIEKAENYAAFQAAAKAARDVHGSDPIGSSDLSDIAKVAKIAAQTYNGKAKTPAVSVTVGNKTLTSGTDYTVSYAKNTNIGEANVTITGTGDYEGTITTTFIIKPAKGQVTKLAAGKKQITVSYKTQKAQSGKTGYRIICKTKGVKATAVNTTAAGKKTVKGLKSKKTYQVKVRAYKTIGGATYYGAYSAVKKVKVK